MLRKMNRRQFGRRAAGLAIVGAVPLIDVACMGGRSANGPYQPGQILTLANDLIRAEWYLASPGFWITGIQDLHSGQSITGPQPAFTLIMADGSVLDSVNMPAAGAPQQGLLQPSPQASRLSERLAGQQITVVFEDAKSRVRVTWRGILRDGSHYVRQEVTLEAIGTPQQPIQWIRLLEFDMPGAQVAGDVDGSPITFGEWFLGFEHPLSQSEVNGNRVQCSLARRLALNPGYTSSYSSVVGLSARGQLRRDFLRYLERERARPYRTFLLYDSWYDLPADSYDQTAALNAIAAFSNQLNVQRKVVLDSFAFDDGWDNHNSVWDFNSGFPNGFAPLKDAAALCQAAPGVWLSPWGGYGNAKQERLAAGVSEGYETDADGFALSGPRYFQRFEQVSTNMIRLYGVNYFKFDGVSGSFTTAPGTQYDSDYDAALGLAHDLRALFPEPFVNLTSGTYPSPFWLLWVDSTWRGGDDHNYAGVGTNRQQWITYRDAATLQNVVQRAPLYPLNSLMLHGLIYASQADLLSTDPYGDFDAEVRSYFGAGTQTQEMYLTPSLLTAQNWDSLAEAADWSRQNASTLVDTHWVGGDPGQLQMYGWAAWSSLRGIITLRNPAAQAQTFELDIGTVFELPTGAPQQGTAHSPWMRDAGTPSITLQAGNPQALQLEPFEVLTLEVSFS